MTPRAYLRTLALLALLIGVLGPGGGAHGHALDPGYLELRLVDRELYAVLWKVPAAGERPMNIAARLPARCEPRTPGQPAWQGGAYFARWTARCPGGLQGGVIRIDGLEQTSTDVLVRFDFADGASEARRLTPGNTAFTVPTQPSQVEVVRTYLLLGVEHIGFGVDHLLFVLALMLLVQGTRQLVMTVTAFTFAHSLTLAAATLGLVRVPGPPVEAAIALSIVFVAVEIVRSHRGRPGLAARRPWLVAFVFGLLHGFGFAGALADIGLPRNSIPAALLFFNIGVEIGQLLFIALVLGLRRVMRRGALRANLSWPAWGWAVPPYFIGSLAVFWLAQRLSAF